MFNTKDTIRDSETQIEARLSTAFGRFVETSVTQILGGTQDGVALDTNFWSQTLAADGSVTLANSMAKLSTGTTSNGSAQIQSLRKARFLTGNENYLIVGIRLGDTGVANNVRRWGVFDTNNGLFFQLSNSTIGIGRRQTATDFIDTTFNGPNPFILDTNFHLYEIIYASGSAYFYQDRKLIHVIRTTTGALTDDMHFKMTYQNVNSGGSTTNADLYLRGSSVQRMGSSLPASRFIWLNTAGTTVLKTGPGRLTKILVGQRGAGNSSLTVYDNTSGSGTIIISIDLVAAIGADYELDAHFDNGLTVVITGATPGGATLFYD